MRRTIIATVMAVGVLLAACGNDDDGETTVTDSGDGDTQTGNGGEATGEVDDLQGTDWVATGAVVNDATVSPAESAKATLEIGEDGRVGGSTGCNSYGGNAEFGDGTITISDVVSTQKSCADKGVRDMEGAVLGTLDGEVTVQLDGDTLTLTNEKGSVLTLETASE